PHSPGFELPSSWCLCQFRSIFLANIKSRLLAHRSAQGFKQFTIHCPENLFYYVFHQELNFEYQSSQRRYNCMYKGREGYQRIGYIFTHPGWGIKKTKMRTVIKVATEKKDLVTQQIVETEFGFSWKERTNQEEYNTETYAWTYGFLKFTFETCRQNIVVVST
ncbi:2810_t:CDS:1, partial [Cetraspora pellucida]